ncbi:MAG TPA: two-component regulator propeller domain-containing protein, partial [Candidatus Paceibacterota bacterium]|nr:two-component regulator propeller domain-containing protein [Candidatus Paceibacterota bacterium]
MIFHDRISNAAIPNFSVQIWEAEQGLPQNTVTTLVQTRDGYLWLGTYSGLARFDGVHFTVFDDATTPGLSSSRVTSLFEADDGTLWIGHETGMVSRYRQGKFETVDLHADWPGGKIQEIVTDERGEVWLLSSTGAMMRLRDGMILTPETGRAPNLVCLARSTNGTVWVARSGRVSQLHEGRLIPLGFNEISTNTGVLGIGASRDGG